MKIIRKLKPDAEIAALVFWVTPKVLWLKFRGVFDYIHPDIRILNRKPAFFWRKNAHIRPWTVDKESDMRRVFEANIPGIITNQVALAVKMRKEIQEHE